MYILRTHFASKIRTPFCVKCTHTFLCCRCVLSKRAKKNFLGNLVLRDNYTHTSKKIKSEK